jgi:ATP-dependent DNA helicase RecG
MSITAQHLSILISQGESDRIEFKTKIINQNEIVKVLTAFANTEGGYLIIGVDDKGCIVGLTEEEASQTEKRLSSICKSLFPYGVNIGIVVVDGKNLLYTKIEKAPNYLSPITTGTGEYFVRSGASITRMSLSSLSSKFSEKKFTGKEITGFVAMSFRDEEEPALIDYFQGPQSPTFYTCIRCNQL